MNKVRSALVLVAMLSFTVEAQAQTVFLIGAEDCGKWISQRTERQKAWLLGLLSGMNLMWSADTSNSPTDALRALSSADQAFLWMDNYCRTNPLEKVSTGAAALFIELVKKKRESQ